ncbi:dethiobiotin synthase [Polyangium aurulentum]|uniref:dethiobiotin synthase n=1 Tax=Polyangium aurulentum TaxID=2567896 RepID=UPI0010AEB7CC|nr:dethiobiotin synthase [Polyangium aurulentum]UQA61490.1 dethiobiotin synthase [Polyangium aurulentum]
MTRIVLIGTGTGIGKTHAGVALVSALAAAGVEVAGLKPIESGVSTGPTDASALAAVGSFHVKQAPYTFVEPISPHLAARREGVTIDLSRVQAWVDGHAARVVVVETAGALLSPLGPGLTNLDLARALRPDVLVLVAPDRLGVLHEVASAMHVLRTLGTDLPAPMLLLQPPAEPDRSTGTNAGELALLGIHPAPLAFPRAEATAEETVSAARALLVAARVLS